MKTPISPGLKTCQQVDKIKKCKIEGATVFNKYLSGARYLFGYDLKSGYHHVDMSVTQHELLGFSYHDYTGKQRHFCFVVMPFGLCTAGFVFTQILRILVMYWRRNGISLVSFFDDGLSAAPDYHTAMINSNTVKSTLIEAGFIPNFKKSIWIPVRVLTWLGFIYDLVQGYIYATPDKLQKCLEMLEAVKNKNNVHVKTLAAITGTLIALHLAFGDIVYIKSKRLQIAIASHKTHEGLQDWDCMVFLNQACKDEIVFWLGYIPIHNGMPVHVNTSSAAVSFSDASETGAASVVTPMPGQTRLKVVTQFNKHQVGSSSTYRELIGGRSRNF